MPRVARHLLIAAMLALYGSASLLGDGLHGVIGIDHASRHVETDEGASASASVDACPVCDFHLLSQIAEDLPEPRGLDVLGVCLDAPPLPDAGVVPLLGARPRAPPLAIGAGPRA